MKKIKGFGLIVFMILSLIAMMFSSCEEEYSVKDGFSLVESEVKSIEKIATKDGVDTYEITFSDDTTRTLKITSNEKEAVNVKQAKVNENGELVLTMTDDSTINAGSVAGEKGETGDKGIGISEIKITNGELVVLYTDNTTANLGSVIGPKGETGAIGNGIKSITKTAENGLVDTYTITYTNDSTDTFTITNGEAGAQGQPGAHGATGNGIKSVEKLQSVGNVDTYRITFTDNSNYDFTVTNGTQGAIGPQGPTGPQGEIGPQGPTGPQGVAGVGISEVKVVDGEMIIIYTDSTEENLGVVTSTDWTAVYNEYKASNPDYTKTQSEWMAEIVEKALTVPEYTVTFNSGTGAVIAPQTIKKGDKVALVAEPTKEGYDFLGWYVGEEKWSFIGYTVTENITLEAKWQPKYVTITFNFDYDEIDNDSEVMEQIGNEKQITVGYNEKIGALPTLSKNDYTFNGWYEDASDEATKATSTSAFKEDVTLYPIFTSMYNCAAGVHKYEYTYTSPTCTVAGTQTAKCSLCGYQEVDPLYSTLPANKALGHQWVEEGATGDGWTLMALARKRTCLREGCDYAEEENLENLTANTTLTVEAVNGGWPGTSEWPSMLTDGAWGTGQTIGAASPKGGEVVFTFIFTTPSEIDQIVMDVKGIGEEGGSDFSIYLWYSGEEDFREEACYTGAWLSTNWGRDNALCVDRSQDDNPLKGIKIVMENATNGQEFFYEMAIARIPDEE